MIDIAAARAGLAAAVRAVVPGSVAVVPAAVDGLAQLPAVVVGMPRWEPGPSLCLDSHEFPLAVAVASNGISQAATVDELDGLWPAVLAGLQDAINTDQTLGGICSAASIDRATFGQFQLQGGAYPAQLITVTLTG